MDFVTFWRTAPKSGRQTIIANLSTAEPTTTNDPISLVRAYGHLGVYASLGPNFQYAVFGRDSIETAEDIMDSHPELVHDIILTLCRLQGTRTDTVTEEEPGKIHHEYRELRPGNHDVPPHSVGVIHELQHKWGREDSAEMIYYGSYDATPLFVRLVEWYCQQHGRDILDGVVTRRSDHKDVRVRDCVTAALGWLEGKITEDTLGLFPYQRLNAHGIINQSWKDSDTSYLHTDGTLPNPDAAIASIELQGYAYDALHAGIRLGLGRAEDNQRWHKIAQRLQEQTMTLFWLDEADYFAQALDFSNPANPRPVATITSNPAALLDSRLVHDLPTEEAERYIQPIVHMLFSEELLTDVGIRCRAIQHRNLLSFIDYHGVNTVWPKETYDIAKGLRRAGREALAENLERRLLRGLERAGEFSEFLYVSRDGTVWYDTAEALAHFGAEASEHELVVPEPAQAWTIAAALRIARTKVPVRTEPGNAMPPRLVTQRNH